jgi:hypothetical protein
VTLERQHPTRGRPLPRATSALFWGGVLVLGAFGTYFVFANYPLFSIGIVLVVLLLTTHAERRRRRKQRAWESARKRRREAETGRNPILGGDGVATRREGGVAV